MSRCLSGRERVLIKMRKDNLLTYLEEQLEKYLGDYDFAIDWNTRQHTVEVIVVLYAENKKANEIEDATGVNTTEDVIEFEDSILIYDPARGDIEQDEYLAVLPYEGKKGMSKRTLIALAKYLRDVLTEGESDLIDFLTDEEADIFELKWDADVFAANLATAGGPTDYVAYPKF